MTLSLTILGCGSSAGVPRPALGWGACDPNNPRNRRRRCSLLAEQAGDGGVTRILIDTSPDLREQLLDAEVDHIDAVFLTHEHADQTHGIDDLRSVVLRQRRRIPVYLNRSTAKEMLDIAPATSAKMQGIMMALTEQTGRWQKRCIHLTEYMQELRDHARAPIK